MNKKIKSFTLSELLVVMIITVIVVGIAFTVLNIVKKQIHTIQMNYSRTTELAFFKQRMYLDFNNYSHINFDSKANQLILKSESDSVFYDFSQDNIIRNTDTLKTKVQIEKLCFEGTNVNSGRIDAITFIEKKEASDSHFFVFKKNDATLFMNQDGF
jgi:competence protein ComGF